MMSRREILSKLGLGTFAATIGFIPEEIRAAPLQNTDHHRTQVIPPRNRHGPTLKAPPPFKRSELQITHRRSKSKRKYHPKLKARTLRAQSTLDTEGNRKDLALTMWGEARGYGTLGMRCIGHVIMNRVKANRSMFGRGIKGVCHKRKHFLAGIQGILTESVWKSSPR